MSLYELQWSLDKMEYLPTCTNNNHDISINWYWKYNYRVIFRYLTGAYVVFQYLILNFRHKIWKIKYQIPQHICTDFLILIYIENYFFYRLDPWMIDGLIIKHSSPPCLWQLNGILKNIFHSWLTESMDVEPMEI